MNSRLAAPVQTIPTAVRPRKKARPRVKETTEAKGGAQENLKKRQPEKNLKDLGLPVRRLAKPVAVAKAIPQPSLIIPLPESGQTPFATVSPTGLHRRYVAWESEVMERRMEMLIFGHAGTRVLVFPTRRGRFYEYEDGGLVEALRPRIERGELQLFCVDGIDGESVYNRSIPPQQRIMNHVQYEQHILHEVLPYSERVNVNSVLVAHGASLGAWHAMNIALRHPHLFQRVVSLSGRYDLTASMPPDFHDLFDGYYDQTIYYNTPLHFLPRMSDPELLEKLQRLEITLVIGEQDPFLANNRDMGHVLANAGIRHSLHLWSGRAHRFARWREMVPQFV
ncbi:MAG: esterase family protein [Candidatus Methylacidiphilales bacterium]